jgi:hypothetical protein
VDRADAGTSIVFYVNFIKDSTFPEPNREMINQDWVKIPQFMYVIWEHS